MRIVNTPIGDLTPYHQNARNHDVDVIARSIDDFGWRQPIVVDDENVIIIGHGRYFAAQQLGHEKVPVHVAKGLPPDRVRLLRLADNKTNERTEWDWQTLGLEVAELTELVGEDDLLRIGFEQDDLLNLMRAEWRPPTEGDMPDADSGTHHVAFTEDQWITVARAVAKARVESEDESLPNARAIELICADYLS